MESGNILNQGAETLYEIKDTLEKWDELRSKCVLLDNDIKKVEGDLSAIKDKCALETENSVCIERAKIKTSYDEKNTLLKGRLKGILKERKEEKNRKLIRKLRRQQQI